MDSGTTGYVGQRSRHTLERQSRCRTLQSPVLGSTDLVHYPGKIQSLHPGETEALESRALFAEGVGIHARPEVAASKFSTVHRRLF